MDLSIARSRLPIYLLSGLSGALSFSSYRGLLSFGLVLFFLLFDSINRRDTFLIAISFFLAANAPIAFDALNARETPTMIVIAYLSSATLASAIYAVFWHPIPIKRPLYVLAAALLGLVPLFGVVIVTSPLFAFLPVCAGLGVGGLILVIAGTFALACYNTRSFRFLIVVQIVIALFLTSTSAVSSAGLSHNTTNLPANDSNVIDSLVRAQRAYLEIVSSRVTFHVFPEFYFGPASPTHDLIFSKQPKSRTAIGGAVQINQDGTLFNSIIKAGNSQNPLYRQRYPIPFSMWHPWDRNDHFLAANNSRIGILENKVTAFLLCYESLLPSAYVEVLVGIPEQIIVLSSTPWENTGHIRKLQKSLISALADVLGAKLAIAYRLPSDQENQNE